MQYMVHIMCIVALVGVFGRGLVHMRFYDLHAADDTDVDQTKIHPTGTVPQCQESRGLYRAQTAVAVCDQRTEAVLPSQFVESARAFDRDCELLRLRTVRVRRLITQIKRQSRRGQFRLWLMGN